MGVSRDGNVYYITLVLILFLTLLNFIINQNYNLNIIEYKLKNEYNPERSSIKNNATNCAGGIATGTSVKNGRNIFWKNRHFSGSNEKPRFEHGAIYDYWMNTGGTWGMNEVGLALGNFAQSGTLDNWGFYSDATYGQTYPIQSYLLGHFDNVADAAYFAAYHMGGSSTLGIVGAEPGVGAVVYSGTNSQGQHVCNLTWMNNTYMALSNSYECDGNYDSKWYDAQGRLDDSYNEHGYIDWRDVIQKGARDVKGRELGSGAFTACCVTKPPSLSSIVAVSGEPRWNGSANIAWTCLARQPLVGIYVPLGASYLQYTDERDIPNELTYGLYGGGMEDYVDEKVDYATNGGGQGSSTYYAEKVREIQNYTFQIENYSFNLYDNYMDSLNHGMSQQTVESMLQSFVNTNIPLMIDAYVNETYIIDGNNNPVLDDIPNQTINQELSFTSIYLDNYVSDTEDIDANITWSYDGNSELIVTIDTNRIANITIPNPSWNGAETITFIAQDTGGLIDSDVATFTVLSSNRPVVLSVELPINKSNNISISTLLLSITIEDPDGDFFNWSVETSPDIGSIYVTGDSNGSKSCEISNLNYSTTYFWFVNVTDNINWTRETFSFTTEESYILSLNSSGSGDGTIEISPAGQYEYGDLVTLWANASAGSTFDGWSGNLIGSNSPETIFIDGNKTIIATFQLIEYAIEINIIGSGNVVKNPDQDTYYYGDIVTIEAISDLGWIFDGWSGDISDENNQTSANINSNIVLNATFIEEQVNDTKSPSNIVGLIVSDAKDGKLDISWEAATDNVAVDYYEIYRDGVFIRNETSISYQDMDLNNDQTYSYQVRAVDTSENKGNLSEIVTGIPTATNQGSNGGGSAYSGGGGSSPIKNEIPIANISLGEHYFAFENFNIIFNGSSSYDQDGYIISWIWNFGDGNKSTGKSTSHEYKKAGNYTLTLTVTDNFGSSSTTSSNILIIKKPNNNLTKPNINGIIKGMKNVKYKYTAMSTDSDNDMLRFVFNWGDNTNDTISDFINNSSIYNATHSWTNAGSYIIKAYAEDLKGLKSEIIELEVFITEERVDSNNENKVSSNAFRLINVNNHFIILFFIIIFVLMSLFIFLIKRKYFIKF